jgi:hypothetical protein
MPGSWARSVRKSATGIPRRVSGPISAPTRPDDPTKARIVSVSRLTPSSAGRGAGHQRTSSTQLRVAKPSTFDRGTTATGSPAAGGIAIFRRYCGSHSTRQEVGGVLMSSVLYTIELMPVKKPTPRPSMKNLGSTSTALGRRERSSGSSSPSRPAGATPKSSIR